MKKLLLFVLLVLSVPAVCAEKLKDYYVSRQTELGLLFFIKPYEVPSQQKGVKPAQFDITMLSTGDSLNLNWSLFYPSVLNIDSITINYVTDGKNASYSIDPIETFFIDAEKRNFHHRYGTKLPYLLLKDLCLAQTPYVFVVHTQGEAIKYGFSAKDWPKHRTRMGRLLMLIDTNRRQSILH